MLFGGKDSFAIEFEIKTLYHNESFIGCGFFVVYINNFIYGIREDDATTFGSILHTLKKLNKSEFYSETPFNRLSDYEICDKFYDANYRIENRYSENVLNEFKSICITDNYKEVHGNYAKKYLNVWNPMEEAFDNGDFILQINENSKVRILGFKTDEKYDLNNLNSVTINKDIYLNILQSVIFELEKYSKL